MVTGSSRGLGWAAARELGRRGCPVIGVDRGPMEAQSRQWAGYEHIVADLADAGGCAAVAEALGGRHLRGILHCAVDFPRDGTITSDALLRVMRVNVGSALELAATAAGRSPAGGPPLILCIVTSPMAFWTVPDRGLYSASKAALERIIEASGRRRRSDDAMDVVIIGARAGLFRSGLLSSTDKTWGLWFREHLGRSAEDVATRLVTLVNAPDLRSRTFNLSFDARLAVQLTPAIRLFQRLRARRGERP